MGIEDKTEREIIADMFAVDLEMVELWRSIGIEVEDGGEQVSLLELRSEGETHVVAFMTSPMYRLLTTVLQSLEGEYDSAEQFRDALGL